MQYYAYTTSLAGAKRTIRVERALTQRMANGHTARLVYGRWHTHFGGWTAEASWHLLKN